MGLPSHKDIVKIKVVVFYMDEGSVLILSSDSIVNEPLSIALMRF